jgi:hypothetical protein
MSTVNSMHDCTVSGLHMWSKHLVENVGWILMADRKTHKNKPTATVEAWGTSLVPTDVEKELYKEKVEGFVASVRLLELHVNRRISATGAGDTLEDLKIIKENHIVFLNHIIGTLATIESNGEVKSKAENESKSQYGGKRGSKKSSKSAKSSKSTKPKKASKGRKGSKKSV